MIKFIVVLALIAVSVQAYPAEEPAATVEIHPREVPEQVEVAVAPEGEETEEGLKSSETAHWGYGGWGGGWGGGWRGGWGGGWGGGWRRGWGGGYGGWGGRGYGWGGGWGYPRYYRRWSYW